jgi:membrane dipeptidase
MIFDGHSDIWTDVTVKILNGETDILRKYHINKLKNGKVSGGIFVIWVDPPFTDKPYDRTIQIIESIKKEQEYSKDSMVIVKSYEEMQEAIKQNKFYIFIGIEGLSSIGNNLDLIDYYYDFGARHASLTWNEENLLATGVKGNPERGITELGKRAVKKINSKNMLLDVSHLNEKSFWDIANKAEGPIIASHSNCKSICDVPRNLTDKQLVKIAELGGLVGINSFNQFVHKDRDKQNIQMLTKHIKHMVDIMGIEHVGIGMDYCDFLDDSSMNSFSDQESSYTVGLEDSSKTYDLVLEMQKIGFTKDDIEKVAYKNYHELIKKVIR